MILWWQQLLSLSRDSLAQLKSAPWVTALAQRYDTKPLSIIATPLIHLQFVVRGFQAGIDVGFLAHPSFVEEEELATITGPLSIAAAETDSIFPAEKRHKSEEILAKSGLPYQINLYSRVAHGFAVRCDLSNRDQLYAKEQALLQAVAWFDHYL